MKTAKKRKRPDRGPLLPAWLKYNWEQIPGAPPAPKTIEECVLNLVFRKEKWLTAKPHLLQALALDVMLAAWETMHPQLRRIPNHIQWLMVVALRLPAYHMARNWSLRSLDRRGKRIRRDEQGFPVLEDPNYGAQEAASDIAREYEREHKKPISDRKLAKILHEQGFRTSTASLREWRRKGTNKKT